MADQTKYIHSPIDEASKPVGGFPSPWVAIVLVVGIFLSASILASLLVSLYPVLHHWSRNYSENWIQNNTIAQFAYTFLAYSLLLLPIVWFLRFKGLTLQSIGLKRPRWRDPGLAILVLPVYFVVYGILISIVSGLVPSLNVNQKQQIGFEGAHGAPNLILTFVSLAVIPPIVEEIVMRGFLFTSLRARLKLTSAVIVTSVIFAAGHLQFGSDAPLLWIAAIDTFTLSLFLIFLRVKTDSLWASICLHAFKNSLAFLTIFILHKG